MHLYSHHPSFLTYYAAGFLLAYSRLVQAISGTVEVDLAFPQNDTYAPAPVFPIAFTFRNSELAGYLQPQVSYTIYPYRGDNSERDPAAGGEFNMAWANWTASDPYIEYGGAVMTLDTEDTWLLIWVVDATTCSASGPLNVTTGSWIYKMIFTTKKGAKKLDLTAATSGELCSRSLNLTFDITGTRDVGNLFENKTPCAVVAEAAPAPTPCAAKIEASAASSISSYLTYRACVAQTDPASWCPPPEKDHGARSLAVPGLAVGGVAFLAMAIGGLGFFMI